MLFGFLSVVAYKYSDIIEFFNNYISSGYKSTIVTDLEKIYTPFSLYLYIIGILILSVSILILLYHKKKNCSLYAWMIGYYLFVLLGTFYISSVFKGFEFELLASTASRSIRDLLTIFYIPQFILLVVILIRVIGFNIKKFDFTDVRNELDGDEKDSEEIEISFNLETHKIKRAYKRSVRETIYYIKENKFIVSCIVVVAFISCIFLVYNNTHSNYDKNYSMGQSFTYEDLEITVEDAMVSNLDYNGNIIKEDKYYVVLKMNVFNGTGDTKVLDYNHFKLIIGDSSINPKVNYFGRFIDFASGEVLSSYAPKDNRTFALTYEISKKQINKKMKISIFTGSVYDKGEYLSKSINVNIKADVFDEVEIVSNFGINDELDFNETSLYNTKLKINQYLIDNKYTYLVTRCNDQNICNEYTNVINVPVNDNRHDNLLLIVDVEYKVDKKLRNMSLKKFSDSYVQIQYRVNGEVIMVDNASVTPVDTERFMAFEVSKKILDADIIQMLVTIRNKQYIINLKK